MDDYITYYEALEYEFVSIVGAVDIYKTLLSNFMDASNRIEKYKPYIDCIGSYGNLNGKILQGIKIKDYSIDGSGRMILNTNVHDMVVEASDKAGFLFSVTWKEYNCVWYISKNKVTLYVDGKEYCTWTR